MTDQSIERDVMAVPAADEGDLDPEGMVGEELPAEHDLDLETFEEDES